MSIANPKKSAIESANLDPTVPAPTTNVAKRRYRSVVTKSLVSVAIALSAGIGAAPAGADPDAVEANPNPFGTLGCSCRETAPVGSPLLREEIERGLREGYTARLPGGAG